MTEQDMGFKRLGTLTLKWGVSLLVGFGVNHLGAQTVQNVPPDLSTLAQTVGLPLLQPSPEPQAWKQLSPQQKQALAPLGAQWGALTAQQQRKWLTLSSNFTQLTVEEQITMHTRMSDWVALSPQQRTLARLNFNKLQNLPKEDKKAKWEAYQSLSPQERQLLSEKSGQPTKSAAPTAKPVEAHRIVQTPIRSSADRPNSANTADTAMNAKGASATLPVNSAIAIHPVHPVNATTPVIDRKTLLPRPPVMVAPAPKMPSMPPTVTPDMGRPNPETSPS